jgi:hypothetical protein
MTVAEGIVARVSSWRRLGISHAER